jgi:hypothetical protein
MKGTTMDGMLTTQELGTVVFDVLRNDFHRPFINGKCNRANIEDEITAGILSGQLGPMNETDVKFICDLVDDLIIAHSEGTL